VTIMGKELLFSITRKDLDVQVFRSGGPGGQHQNKTESGVRIVHRESGAVGESRSERSQHANRKLALQRLVASPKFKIWHAKKVHEIQKGKTIEQLVEESMKLENLKIEVRDETGKWVDAKDEGEERTGVQ
jgi:protein subunit release factor B